MQTAITGCQTTNFVHQVDTKQYELRTKSEHEINNTGLLEGVTLTQR
jgi:hypothetical protein